MSQHRERCCLRKVAKDRCLPRQQGVSYTLQALADADECLALGIPRFFLGREYDLWELGFLPFL